MIAVVLGTWDDTGWAGFLLDQGFATPAAAPGTGTVVPPVRAVTADMRRRAFEGMPAALGRPALDGSASVPIAATRAPTRLARRTDRLHGAVERRYQVHEHPAINRGRRFEHERVRCFEPPRPAR